ncbi:MAG: hypothetical protein EOP09_15990 [Proteobacteria bacterium]|nr:MAG: hypothetical protein EOP09_15990 [Pseudomonadota bacterium]
MKRQSRGSNPVNNQQSAERQAAKARELNREALRKWTDWLVENGSYKLVALFVTLILWVTILGRRDFQLSKEMDLEFLLPQNLTVASQTIDRKVTVKVSGPRMALKKFSTNPGSITVDLVRSQPGPVRALITPRNVEVPFGVKVISISPDVVNLNLIAAGSEEIDAPVIDEPADVQPAPRPPARPALKPASKPTSNPTSKSQQKQNNDRRTQPAAK